MEYQFKLDTTLVSDPIDWQDMTITIERDDFFKGLAVKYIPKLTFHGDGYDLINTAFDDNGFCHYVEIEILYRCSPADSFVALDGFETGFIFLSDCVFDDEHCTVEVEVTDNNFSALINNNKEIEFQVDVGRSKNDEAITAATDQSVDFFDPSAVLATYAPTNIESYTMFEVFEFLVAAMSDGGMTFASTLFDAGGANEDICISTGAALTDSGNDHAPVVSFAKSFENMDKLYNLGMKVTNTSGVPVLHIEPYEDLYDDSSTALTLEKIANMRRSLFSDRLYSKVEVGSETTEEDGGVFQFPDVRFISHKEEEYHLLGTCNIDNTLNLVNDWIIDSNVIEDIVVNANDDYDDDIIIVETDLPGTAQCTKFDEFNAGAAPYVYNYNLINLLRLDNYLKGIPNSLAHFLGDGSDRFRAEYTGADVPLAIGLADRIDFDDDFTPPNEDPNGNYTPAATFDYNCPIAGNYTFSGSIRLVDITFDTTSGDLVTDIDIMRNGVSAHNTQYTLANTTLIVNKTYTYNGGFYCDPGDLITIEVTITQTGGGPAITASWAATSFFKTESVPEGGIWKTYDPEDFRIQNYTFSFPLSITDWNILIGDPTKAISINATDDSANAVTGFLQKIEYKHPLQTGDWDIIK